MGLFAVPTKRGLLFLLLSLAALAVAFMNSGLITALTAGALSAILLSSWIMAFFSLAGISLQRALPHNGNCQKDLYLEIRIKNHFPLFRQECIVLEELPFLLSSQAAFAVPALAPRENLCMPFRIKAEKRGEYFLEKVYLCSGDPLGLFRKKKLFRIPAHIEIQPRIFPLESLMTHNNSYGLPNAEGRQLGHAGKGTEFFGVRPYRAGDEVRHIHWKSTAAKGRLMVKEFEAAAVDQIVILLDTEKKKISWEPCDNNFEFLISCAASITGYLSKKYCHLQFIASDGLHGEIHHLSGDAASVKGRICNVLTLLQGGENSLAETLSAAAENIRPGSVVYLLTMSKEFLADYVTILEEQDCYCFCLYAPAENFPPVEPDRPRIVKREKKEGISQKFPCPFFTVDFQSKAEEILKNGDPYEKI